MSIKMKVMVNIAKYVNLAEIEMKQLGAPQFVMYTKEPGASREVNTTFIKVSLPLSSLSSLFLALLFLSLLCLCSTSSLGATLGRAVEEQQKRVASERKITINNNISTYTRITDNTESEKNISFVATFQYFRCLPYPTPQSYGLHLKIAWQVNKSCFVTLPEVNPWEEKYYFLEKYLGPFDKKSSLQKIKLAKNHAGKKGCWRQNWSSWLATAF